MLIAIASTFVCSVISKSDATKAMSYVNLSLFIIFFIMNIWCYRRAEKWVPDPEVGAFLQLTTVQLPTIAFMFTAYSSMLTGFVQSSCQFNVRLFGGTYQFNSAFLESMDNIGVLVFTAVLNFFIEPFMRKRGIHFGVKKRLIVGAIGFMISMSFAAGFEVFRRNKGNDGSLVQPWTPVG